MTFVAFVEQRAPTNDLLTKSLVNFSSFGKSERVLDDGFDWGRHHNWDAGRLPPPPLRFEVEILDKNKHSHKVDSHRGRDGSRQC